MTDSLLIGRDHPAAVLRAAVERTTVSHGGLALVTGEAGIGKTTLVTDVAAAYRRDSLTLFASSWESEAVPEYWLWTQILRSLRGRLGDDGWDALPVAPPVAALLGGAEGSLPSEFELFDAVTQVLIAASHRRPLLIVLDDLHFADCGSVELLKFAAQHTWFERILFVGTYRDTDIDVGHPLRAKMLPLVAKATMIALDGLDETGVAELVRTTVGDAPDRDVLAEITRRTGGNPFFVEQTAQLWATGQPVDAGTTGMRDALQRRLDQLDERLTRTLVLASVGGREFHQAVMAQAAGMDVHRIEAALDDACRTGLIRRERDHYMFVHDLVRESLYRSIPESEAARHHACIVRALTEDESLQKHMHAAEMSRHAWLADDSLEAAAAVEFMARAGDEANTCVAGSTAEIHYRRAVERCTPDMVRRRVLLRLELGGVLKWRRRDTEARAVYDRARLEAADSGDVLLLIRAIMASPQDERPTDLVRLKTEAFETLVGEPPDPELGHEDLTRQLLHNYMLAARERGSDDDIAFGLWATHAILWGPGTAARRQALVEELEEVAQRTGRDEDRLFAASLRWVALLEQGDPAFRNQLEVFAGLARNSEAEHWHGAVHIDRSIIDLLQGRYEDAAARIDAARRPGDDPMYEDMMRLLEWLLRFARGEAPEPVAHPWPQGFGPWVADVLNGLSALRRGDIAQARRVHDRFAADADPYDAWISLRLRFEAELAAAERDTEMIARLRRRLEPNEGEWLVAMWGCAVSGPVSHWLGVLAAALGERERAAKHFAAAAEQADRLDARPWAELSRKAAADLAGTVPTPVSDDVESLFHRDGSTWTLRFDGVTVHLPHTKGLADLRSLLERPGTETPAVELLDPEAGPELENDARLGGDDLLDAEARTRYRDHLETLDEQIDTAGALGDDARAAALDTERQALIDQLKTATGLGGRSRRLGDNAERARKSVTNRIRNTLKKIESVHPSLAEHLRASVSTGSSCAYRPEGEAPRWRF
ncbi:ATP-binding protein [Glycomyces xiaoerkulensis]|uniref:ATP-binding protein n=1 Tax=Glycomyces xiaoerkulensis TaxID=2038139 RepID=UPI000C262C6F|nr:AAA family ATPase [Glycomyces xiaoerkulensis]